MYHPHFPAHDVSLRFAVEATCFTASFYHHQARTLPRVAGANTAPGSQKAAIACFSSTLIYYRTPLCKEETTQPCLPHVRNHFNHSPHLPTSFLGDRRRTLPVLLLLLLLFLFLSPLPALLFYGPCLAVLLLRPLAYRRRHGKLWIHRVHYCCCCCPA